MNYCISYSHPLWENGCQLLVIKWIDIDLSSSSGVVKCCVIIGLSNLTSLGPTFPVKWGNIYKKNLTTRIICSYCYKPYRCLFWWLILENIWYWWIGFYFMLYDSKISTLFIKCYSMNFVLLQVPVLKFELWNHKLVFLINFVLSCSKETFQNGCHIIPPLLCLFFILLNSKNCL